MGTKTKTPILDRLIADKIVWLENGQYYGKTLDGQTVDLGTMQGYERIVERYLAEYPREKW